MSSAHTRHMYENEHPNVQERWLQAHWRRSYWTVFLLHCVCLALSPCAFSLSELDLLRTQIPFSLTTFREIHPHHQTSSYSFLPSPSRLTSCTYGPATYLLIIGPSALIASQLDWDRVFKFIKGEGRRKKASQDNVRNLSSECGMYTQTEFSHSLDEQSPGLLCLKNACMSLPPQ